MTLDLEELEILLKSKLSALDREQAHIEEKLRAVATVQLASGRLGQSKTTSMESDPSSPENTMPEMVATNTTPSDTVEIT